MLLNSVLLLLCPNTCRLRKAACQNFTPISFVPSRPNIQSFNSTETSRSSGIPVSNFDLLSSFDLPSKVCRTGGGGG